MVKTRNHEACRVACSEIRLESKNQDLHEDTIEKLRQDSCVLACQWCYNAIRVELLFPCHKRRNLWQPDAWHVTSQYWIIMLRALTERTWCCRLNPASPWEWNRHKLSPWPLSGPQRPGCNLLLEVWRTRTSWSATIMQRKSSCNTVTLWAVTVATIFTVSEDSPGY